MQEETLLPTRNYRDPPKPRQLRGLCVLRHFRQNSPSPSRQAPGLPPAPLLLPTRSPSRLPSAPCASPAQSLSALCLPPQPQGMVVSVGWVPGCSFQPWSGFAQLTPLPHYWGAFGWSTRPRGPPVGRGELSLGRCGHMCGRTHVWEPDRYLRPLGAQGLMEEPWFLGRSGTPSLTQEEYSPRLQGTF